MLLDESGQLGWASDLQAFSGSAGDSSSQIDSAAASPACAAEGPLPPPPAPTLDWALSLSSSAVRYEPRDVRLAAAVLTVGSISWRQQAAAARRQGSTLELRRLALHVGAGSAGGGGSSNGSPDKLQTGLAPSLAGTPGFHPVAAEAGITVHLPPGSGGDGQPSKQQATREVVVTNQGLTITLSRRTLLLLRGLARQLSGHNAEAGVAPPSAAAAMDDSGSLTPPAPPGSLAASTASAYSEGGQRQAGPAAAAGSGVNVMDGVLPAVYASPRRPAEHPLEASVFLDGGWGGVPAHGAAAPSRPLG